MIYDVFNGDADGIIALHQLRLEHQEPGAALITGVKRDIKLLDRVIDTADSQLTVLDISLNSNRNALLKLLTQGNIITYIDHHHAGDIPVSSNLTTHIDPSPDICTSLIVNQLLQGKYSSWAVAAAFGDNLHESAGNTAHNAGLSQTQVAALRELGELLNYNGYGAKPEDLHFTPESLYLSIRPYKDPFEFIAESPDLDRLRNGFQEDMNRAMLIPEIESKGPNRIYFFPDAPWARRVVGVYSNLRAREESASAHAIIVENSDGSLRISVRAPLDDKKNADTLCLSFPTGGGREAAAGINQLPPEMLNKFIDQFNTIYSS